MLKVIFWNRYVYADFSKTNIWCLQEYYFYSSFPQMNCYNMNEKTCTYIILYGLSRTFIWTFNFCFDSVKYFVWTLNFCIEFSLIYVWREVIKMLSFLKSSNKGGNKSKTFCCCKTWSNWILFMNWHLGYSFLFMSFPFKWCCKYQTLELQTMYKCTT